MSRILHIVPGIDDVANGMVVVAHLLAKEQGDAEVVDLNAGLTAVNKGNTEEVWVHGMWLPKEWRVCLKALKVGKRLVRMTHGSLSPVYLKYQSPFKKRLVSPIERYLLRKADKVIATCEAEADWIRAYEPRVKSIEVTDLKRFFKLQLTGNGERNRPLRGFATIGKANTPSKARAEVTGRELHLLYLSRRHPLKGLEYLETAVRQIQDSSAPQRLCARIISNASGQELEDAWEWCDVLILPTLSDNFGLVIAEALERGKCVVTTDGAPAWGDGNTYNGRLTYVQGFSNADNAERVRMLKLAIETNIKE